MKGQNNSSYEHASVVKVIRFTEDMYVFSSRVTLCHTSLFACQVLLKKIKLELSLCFVRIITFAFQDFVTSNLGTVTVHP